MPPYLLLSLLPTTLIPAIHREGARTPLPCGPPKHSGKPTAGCAQTSESQKSEAGPRLTSSTTRL